MNNINNLRQDIINSNLNKDISIIESRVFDYGIYEGETKNENII